MISLIDWDEQATNTPAIRLDKLPEAAQPDDEH